MHRCTCTWETPETEDAAEISCADPYCAGKLFKAITLIWPQWLSKGVVK